MDTLLFPKKKLTAEDYRKTPDGPPWLELVDGQLLLEPSPTSDHQGTARELVGALYNYLSAFPIGILFFAPLDVYLNETNVFQPDIAVVLNARRGIIAKQGIVGAPDFVVEILSPSNHRIDRGPKLREYARSGVREVWIIEPEEKSIACFRSKDRLMSLACTWGTNATLFSDLFPGFSVSADRIFP